VKLETSYRQIWVIAYPIMLSSIAQNLINVTDTIFLGRVGAIELGAMGLVGVFFYSFMMIGFGFSKGAQITIARRAGEGNLKAIGDIMGNLLYIMLFLAVAIFLLLQWYAPTILAQFVDSKAVFDASLEYLKYRNYSIFLGFLGFAAIAFYVGIGETRIIIISTVLLAVINVLLNYSLIFGKFGLPAMGIAGAGLASTIAESISTVFLVSYTLLNASLKKYNIFRVFKLNKALINKLVRLSAPIVFQFIIALGSWFVFFSLIENLGEEALAVSNIIKTLYLFFMVTSTGLSSACQTLISNLIGQNKPDWVWATTKKIILMSIVLTLAFGVLIALLPDWLLSIVTDDMNLITAARPILYLLIFILLFYAISSPVYHAVSGTGAIKVSLIFQLIAVAAYMGSMYWVIFKIDGNLLLAWSTEFAYWGVLFVLSVWFIQSDYWKGLKI